MLGIDTTQQRRQMVEGVKAIMRLFTEEGGITIDGSFFRLNDAHLQVKPYQQPHMPIFVADTISPSGMVAAGELGCGVLSVAAFAAGGLEGLPKRWAVAEETAAEHGKTVSRANWRMVMPIHLADSKKEALEDIREGGNSWIQDYFIDTLGAKIQFEEYPGQPREEMTVDRMVGRGGAIVGTPDDAIKRIREVQEASGGFGGLLGLAHEWASREKTLRSYELFARYVMPQFQGTVAEIEDLAAMGRRTARVAVQQVGRWNHDRDERLQAASRGHGREALGNSRPAGHPDPAVSVTLVRFSTQPSLTEAAAIFSACPSRNTPSCVSHCESACRSHDAHDSHRDQILPINTTLTRPPPVVSVIAIAGVLTLDSRISGRMRAFPLELTIVAFKRSADSSLPGPAYRAAAGEPHAGRSDEASGASPGHRRTARRRDRRPLGAR